MAGERSLPGLALRAYWTPGSNGWNTAHDDDTRKLSVVTQLGVKSRVASLPGSPANGDIHILTAGANEGDIAVRDAGAWVYITPNPGWRAFDEAAGVVLLFDGSDWIVPPVTPAFNSADARKFLRMNDAGTALVWSFGGLNVSNKTADYTPILADAGSLIRINDTAAHNLTIPPAVSVAFPLGTVIQIRQVGSGQVTVVAGAGVTVNTAETYKLRKAGSSAAITLVGTNEWDLTGDLELV